MCRGNNAALFAIILLCLAVSVLCVVYPVYVIRPFRAQGPRELPIALSVLRWRPIVSLACMVIGSVCAGVLWRRAAGRIRRILLAATPVALCGLFLLGRINIYELMFHPNEHPSFTGAQDVKLDPDEKVIAVRVNGEARAYPIRSISYHHVINDEVGKRAIVATY